MNVNQKWRKKKKYEKWFQNKSKNKKTKNSFLFYNYIYFLVCKKSMIKILMIEIFVHLLIIKDLKKYVYLAEMSIAAEKLPLPRRDVRKKSYRAAMVYKKKLPHRCRDATAYKKILPRRDGL